MKRATLVIVLMGSICARIADAVSYEVVDLGMLPAGYSSDFAEDINNLGQVTGYVTTPSASSQAIRWTSGGGYELLSTLGGTDSTGLAINDNSVVVGTSDTGVGIQTRAFRHQAGGSIQSLGTLGGNFGTAYDINANGIITGSSHNGSTTRAFLWQQGVGMTDIGSFTLTGSSVGFGINSAGHIAGRSTTAGGQQHGFFWNGTSFSDVTTIGMGTETSALALNDSDTVVGYGTLNAIGSTYGAFKWTSGSGITQLGQLFAYDTRAQDVNNQGDAVGWSWIDGMGNSRAVIWKGGGPVANLNDLIDPTSGWLLTSATGINDAGQIVGVGQQNGQSRAFLLTPIPEPSTIILAAWAAILLRCLVRRQ